MLNFSSSSALSDSGAGSTLSMNELAELKRKLEKSRVPPEKVLLLQAWLKALHKAKLFVEFNNQSILSVLLVTIADINNTLKAKYNNGAGSLFFPLPKEEAEADQQSLLESIRLVKIYIDRNGKLLRFDDALTALRFWFERRPVSSETKETDPTFQFTLHLLRAVAQIANAHEFHILWNYSNHQLEKLCDSQRPYLIYSAEVALQEVKAPDKKLQHMINLLLYKFKFPKFCSNFSTIAKRIAVEINSKNIKEKDPQGYTALETLIKWLDKFHNDATPVFQRQINFHLAMLVRKCVIEGANIDKAWDLTKNENILALLRNPNLRGPTQIPSKAKALMLIQLPQTIPLADGIEALILYLKAIYESPFIHKQPHDIENEQRYIEKLVQRIVDCAQVDLTKLKDIVDIGDLYNKTNDPNHKNALLKLIVHICNFRSDNDNEPSIFYLFTIVNLRVKMLESTVHPANIETVCRLIENNAPITFEGGTVLHIAMRGFNNYLINFEKVGHNPNVILGYKRIIELLIKKMYEQKKDLFSEVDEQGKLIVDLITLPGLKKWFLGYSKLHKDTITALHEHLVNDVIPLIAAFHFGEAGDSKSFAPLYDAKAQSQALNSQKAQSHSVVVHRPF